MKKILSIFILNVVLLFGNANALEKNEYISFYNTQERVFTDSKFDINNKIIICHPRVRTC